MNLVKTTILLLLFLLCIGIFYKYQSNFKRIPDLPLYFAGCLVLLVFLGASHAKESFQSTCPQRALVDDIINLRKPEYMFNMAADIKVAEQSTAFFAATLNIQTLLRGLYNAKTKECWRCFVDICLWMMNYNSVLFPNGTKATSVKSLATPADRRNNFAELLKQPEYSYMNDVEPRFFGTFQPSGLAITTLNTTIKPGLVKMTFETMWEFLFRLATQTQMFLMCIRVNSPESDVELHKDIDDIFKWFEKVAYFLHQSIPLDNNIGFSQLINITMACLMNCRDLKTIGARAEAFVRYNINYEEAPNPNPFSSATYNYIPPFEIIPDPTKTWNKRGITDADRQILQGYLWSESWREYKILNYQQLYMKVLWPFMMIMQETKTPFNKDAFKVNLLKVVRNTSADLILEKAYKDKGLTLAQFSQIMKTYFTLNPTKVITLEELLAEIDKGWVQVSSACLAPSANVMKTKVINTSDTVTTICSTFTDASECAFTPVNVKLLMYYSVCGKLAKYGRVVKRDQCIWANSGGVGTDQNFYNYFYAGGGMPATFGTLYMTDLSSKDFVDALRLWVGTEKSVFPT
jgi:hypothetical protein